MHAPFHSCLLSPVWLGIVSSNDDSSSSISEANFKPIKDFAEVDAAQAQAQAQDDVATASSITVIDALDVLFDLIKRVPIERCKMQIEILRSIENSISQEYTGNTQAIAIFNIKRIIGKGKWLERFVNFLSYREEMIGSSFGAIREIGHGNFRNSPLLRRRDRGVARDFFTSLSAFNVRKSVGEEGGDGGRGEGGAGVFEGYPFGDEKTVGLSQDRVEAAARQDVSSPNNYDAGTESEFDTDIEVDEMADIRFAEAARSNEGRASVSSMSQGDRHSISSGPSASSYGYSASDYNDFTGSEFTHTTVRSHDGEGSFALSVFGFYEPLMGITRRVLLYDMQLKLASDRAWCELFKLPDGAEQFVLVIVEDLFEALLAAPILYNKKRRFLGPGAGGGEQDRRAAAAILQDSETEDEMTGQIQYTANPGLQGGFTLKQVKHFLINLAAIIERLFSLSENNVGEVPEEIGTKAVLAIMAIAAHNPDEVRDLLTKYGRGGMHPLFKARDTVVLKCLRRPIKVDGVPFRVDSLCGGGGSDRDGGVGGGGGGVAVAGGGGGGAGDSTTAAAAAAATAATTTTTTTATGSNTDVLDDDDIGLNADSLEQALEAHVEALASMNGVLQTTTASAEFQSTELGHGTIFLLRDFLIALHEERCSDLARKLQIAVLYVLQGVLESSLECCTYLLEALHGTGTVLPLFHCMRIPGFDFEREADECKKRKDEKKKAGIASSNASSSWSWKQRGVDTSTSADGVVRFGTGGGEDGAIDEDKASLADIPKSVAGFVAWFGDTQRGKVGIDNGEMTATATRQLRPSILTHPDRSETGCGPQFATSWHPSKRRSPERRRRRRLRARATYRSGTRRARSTDGSEKRSSSRLEISSTRTCGRR